MDLSGIETEIIRAVQRMVWNAQIWFPMVQRQLLNIHADATDEQLHATVVSLIEQHALVPINPDPSLRRISTSANSVRCLENALSSHEWVDEMPAALAGTRESGMQESPLDMTYLESQVILAIENEGGFPFCGSGLWTVTRSTSDQMHLTTMFIEHFWASFENAY